MADQPQIDQWIQQARVADGAPMSNERLEAVFDLVKSPEDWKNPIDTTVAKDKATAAEIETAVSWFTGSLPMVADKGDRWEVVADGYYEAMVD
jgi:hypothetical protein